MRNWGYFYLPWNFQFGWKMVLLQGPGVSPCGELPHNIAIPKTQQKETTQPRVVATFIFAPGSVSSITGVFVDGSPKNPTETNDPHLEDRPS